MFENIGGKIKGLAKVIFWIEAIGLGSWALFFVENMENPLFPLLLAAAGILVAWISSWFLYGFGEIIDKLTEIEENTRRGKKRRAANRRAEEEMMEEEIDFVGEAVENEENPELNRLLVQGLITQEEYQKILEKDKSGGGK